MHPYQALLLGSFENASMEATNYKQTSFSQNLETTRGHYMALKEQHGAFETKMGAPKKDQVDPYYLFVDVVVNTVFGGANLAPLEKEKLKKTVKEGLLCKVSHPM